MTDDRRFKSLRKVKLRTMQSKMRIILIIVALLALAAQISQALNNGLGRTPPMGWNSWNAFHCEVNEAKIIDTINIMSTRLKRFGYEYINIDDCWAVSRDENNTLVADPVAFPNGIAYLANYAHQKGLKFGIYADCGNLTCAKRPGSYGYEKIDAQTFADWGVDYLKYDYCYSDHTVSGEYLYSRMRDALNATGRPIFYSLCNAGKGGTWNYGAHVGNAWRTTEDIGDSFDELLRNIHNSIGLARFAGPGGWNDPDMLEVGNGGMQTAQYQAHFALWCLMKAPLLLGNDLTKLTDDTMQIITNTELIAINQDPLGIAGDLVWQLGPMTVWAGPLIGGDKVVVMFYSGPVNDPHPMTIGFNFTQLGLPMHTKAVVRDLYAHKDVGVFVDSFSADVVPQGVFAGRISPVH